MVMNDGNYFVVVFCCCVVLVIYDEVFMIIDCQVVIRYVFLVVVGFE